ncbi:SDR family NAD(P)-dependent oxidoreductase [Xanthomonas campestris pv. phormiicola]|nr:SDR family NAD(P)-dependent oxidoreductase [Xanthomonas campestris pv. phormiicola]UYC17070.1 SDR family NAD(P)-dependent oxidoreductase [Xanthomonas campestris pv. phormiicola]
MTSPNVPLVLSASSEPALHAAAQRLHAQCQALSEAQVQALCRQQLQGAHTEYRAALFANDRAGLCKGLALLAQGRAARNLVLGRADRVRQPVLVFPGQGPLWPGMTTGLAAALPDYRAALVDHARRLQPRLAWNLAQALDDGQSIDRLVRIQPLQFALASALAQTWRAFGIQPAAVVGHSVGEAAAAHAGGYLDPSAAAALTALWGEALTAIEGRGGMLAVAAALADLQPLLADLDEPVSVAAVNGPRSVTVSGTLATLARLQARLADAGLWAWEVPGGQVAGHGPQVDALREAVVARAPGHALHGEVPYYSSVAGARVPAERLDADYWFGVLRQTVRFQDSLQALIGDGHRLFVEVSPHPVLTSLIDEALRSAGVAGAAVATLDQRKDDRESLLQGLAHAFVHGAPVDWPRVLARLLPAQPATATATQTQTATEPEATAQAPQPTAPTVAAQGGDALLRAASLRERSVAEQRRLLLDLIAREMQALVDQGFANETQSFRDCGFTSLHVVEFADALSAALDLALPVTLVYDHPTPRALVQYLRDALGLLSPQETEDLPGIGVIHHDDPIAIVGMACRYPGAVDGPEALWDLLLQERDAISGYPTDRGWDLANLHDPEPGRFGKISTPSSGFLHEASAFDPGFFGISPREAITLEPQQRLLLEVCWEALERAGLDPGALHGSLTGVYAGIMGTEYGTQIQHAPEDVSGYGYMGTATCVAAGRVAYSLGLQGPALAIDSACSSSLVAIHTACEALRNGDCTLALAGGVTVMPTPGVLIDFSQQRVLSPDGRCKAFSASADGVGLGEGVGMLVLERLSQAEANGRRILGVIRGSAVNQDGASNGLTAPNGTAQQRVIRHALANAALQPQDVDAVDAHGTGTRLGDPIEANALLATYGQRPPERPLLLGSIKSNIGHTQAAAGVASVIKMVLAARHGTLPRSLHITAPSTEVDWSTGAIRLLSERQPWPEVAGRPRRAGISSFGVSGTNAHLILEQYPACAAEPGADTRAPLWPLAARSDAALRAAAERLAAHLQRQPALAAADVAYTLGVSRSRFACRAAVRGDSREALLEALQALADGSEHPGLLQGHAGGGEKKRVFVFPGQGAQWAGMGMDLYDTFAVYRQAIDQVETALRAHVDWSLSAVLRGAPEAPALERIDVVQPALFAVMVALARLWQSLGCTPDAVIGHSQGEIAAAHVAGALSLDEAVKIVAIRSRLMLAQAGTGAMATVGLSEPQAADLVARVDPALTLAVFNSPNATVVSGGTEAIERLLQSCERDGVMARRVAVDVAGHSPHLDGLRAPLLEHLAGLRPQATTLPFHSTVAGYAAAAPLDGRRLDAAYWCDNLCLPVRFADTVRALGGAGEVTFLECSPHPILLAALEDSVGERASSLGSLQRNRPGRACLEESLARLYVGGHDLNWRALSPTARIVELPTYPFEHRHVWLTAQDRSDVAGAGQRPTRHPLLGAAVELPEGGLLLTGTVGLGTQPWLADHAAAGVVLLPGTAFLDMLLHAASETDCGHVLELTLRAPLVLAEQDRVDLLLGVERPDAEGARLANVYARRHGDAAAAWTLHASAQLLPTAPQPLAPLELAWPPAGADAMESTALYQRLADAGYDYGPAFKGITAAWRDGDRSFVEVTLPETVQTGTHLLHPALLDAALHPLALGERDSADAPLRLPFALGGITAAADRPRRLRVLLQRLRADTHAVSAYDESGTPVLHIAALHLRAASRDTLRDLARVPPAHDLLRLAWSPLPAAPRVPRGTPRWAQLGHAPLPLDAPVHADMAALQRTLEDAAAPEALIWPLPVAQATDLAQAARALCSEVIAQLQAWLAEPRLAESTLLVVTRKAVATADGEALDPAQAAAWGLLHSAQNENPGRLLLLDTDAPLRDAAPVQAALAGAQRQLALRRGQWLAPHLARGTAQAALIPPAGDAAWRLEIARPGNLDDLALQPAPRAEAPLQPGQIRLAVRAAGVNFYDVVCALGLVPPQHELGTEAAGVVTEVGPGVDDLQPGDRVLAMGEGAFGPRLVADRRSSRKLPADWSFAQGAGFPVAFLTAYYGLVDLAQVRAGDKVLIHAAAGGVGQAALQLARHLGAEIFATAHPDKWPTLLALGVAPDHIASSRELGFAERFAAVLGAQGLDVVLNSLAGEAIDASLGLLGHGGRFVELGKTDVRDPEEIARRHPGRHYRYLDRPDKDPEATGRMLDALLQLVREGALTPLPITAFDLREAVQALRWMQQGRHTGKVVLTLPRRLDPDGTVLISGGTGTLGGLLARHLVGTGQARHLLLASRRGAQAEGAETLRQALEAEGAQVRVVACDLSDPQALDALLASIPAAHPLTGIVHTAGVLADATVPNLGEEELARVFAPKVDAAWLLHTRTRQLDLAQFALYSSSAGTLGSPGQANYAAANRFLDALAHERHRQGLPATSLAWGWWQPVTGLSGRLSAADNARIARTGLAPITAEHGHALFDAALAAPRPVVVAAPLNLQTLRRNQQAGALHPLLERLAGNAGGPRGDAATAKAQDLRQALAGLDAHARARQLQGVIAAQIAIVLGLEDASQVLADGTFKDIGIDSLMALELSNRLAKASGLRLAATLAYDQPTPAALASYLDEQLFPEGDASPTDAAGTDEAQVRALLAGISLAALREAGLLAPLLRLADAPEDAAAPAAASDLETASADELVALALATGTHAS